MAVQSARRSPKQNEVHASDNQLFRDSSAKLPRRDAASTPDRPRKWSRRTISNVTRQCFDCRVRSFMKHTPDSCKQGFFSKVSEFLTLRRSDRILDCAATNMQTSRQLSEW